jgi:hypothetical protein
MNRLMGVVRDYVCNGPSWPLLILYYFRSYSVSCSFHLAFSPVSHGGLRSRDVVDYLSRVVYNGARRIQHDHLPLNSCAKDIR